MPDRKLVVYIITSSKILWWQWKIRLIAIMTAYSIVSARCSCQQAVCCSNAARALSTGAANQESVP